MSHSNKKKKKRGGARNKQSRAPTASPSSSTTSHHSDGAAVAVAPPFERPETYTLIAKEVPSDMLPDLLSARPKMLGASAVRQRYLQGVPVSDVFIDLLRPPSRVAGAESPMLVQLRSFFPVYPFNYCATCLGKYHTGACPTLPLADVPPPLLPPVTAAATEADHIGRLEDGDDDELPPLLDEDEVDDNADNDSDDELPPLLDNSDLSADDEAPSPSRAQRSFVKPGQSSSARPTARGSARTPTGGDSRPSDGPEGNYYDDYRYNPPLVYEQSVSFVTGAVPPIRDFSRHRAAILTFLMGQNVDVAQITDVQPTTTGFKVFLASSIALRDFGRQTECVVPTLGKVKIEVFNGYRRDAKPGWHDTGNDEDFTDEEDYDEDGYYRQAPAASSSRKAAKTKTKAKTKAKAKGASAAAVPTPADDDDMPALMDGSSSEDEDDMPALQDGSSDESDHDDYALRRPQKPMKPPRAVIVSRIKEEQEQRKLLDEHLRQLEMTRNQVLKRHRRQARRPEDDEAEAIRFADFLSGVERRKEWKCVRVDCKNPVIYHYEKRLKAKCEKGCVAQYHKSCWQEVAKGATPHGGHALCAQCGAHIVWTSLRINFGEKKKLYAQGDESVVDPPNYGTSTTTTTATKNESEGDASSEERKRDWLASAKRQEEELKRRRDEAERKRREQEELAKREEEERRQKRRQERKQRKRERDRKGEPQMGEMVVVAKAGERAQPKPTAAAADGSSDAPSVDPTTLLQAAPDKIHKKKAERDELPESAKQDLERRKQRNAKKKQKKLEKRQAKNALRIDLASPPSASTTSTGTPVSLAVADWPAEALRVAQSEGYQLPPPGRVVVPIVDPVTGAVIDHDEEDIWAVPAGDNGAATTTPAP